MAGMFQRAAGNATSHAGAALLSRRLALTEIAASSCSPGCDPAGSRYTGGLPLLVTAVERLGKTPETHEGSQRTETR
jgi:hypothetical protein